MFRLHGGPDDGRLASLGLTREDILDLSASTNPWGPSPRMEAALREVDVSRYPDSAARQATGELSRWLGQPAECVSLGNGAAELLWSVATVLPSAKQGVLIVEPTFCEFRAACLAAAIPVYSWKAREQNDFAIDLEAVADCAMRHGCRVVYVCSPNTPTGRCVPAAELERWARQHAQLTIVVDQSFLTLSDEALTLRQTFPDNVVCVRSMTKDHGIPGVRVGYAVGPPELGRAIVDSRPAWTVSAYAQAAVLAALRDESFVEASRLRLAEGRGWLTAQLRGIGLNPVSSQAPFVLLRVPFAKAVADELFTEHRISVRHCASFGLPDHLRISIRGVQEMERLVVALKACVSAPVHPA